jgi:hypothetical protein
MAFYFPLEFVRLLMFPSEPWLWFIFPSKCNWLQLGLCFHWNTFGPLCSHWNLGYGLHSHWKLHGFNYNLCFHWNMFSFYILIKSWLWLTFASSKVPLKHKPKSIVLFNNRKIISLQSNEDAMDSQFTLLKQYQVLWLSTSFWNWVTHIASKFTSFYIPISFEIFPFVIKGVCTSLFPTMPKHYNIPSMYLHWLKLVIQSCWTWFCCTPKNYWISPKFTISNFFKRFFFQQNQIIKTKIRSSKYKIIMTKEFPLALLKYML